MPYEDKDGIPVSLEKLCRIDPEWAAGQIRSLRDNDGKQTETIRELTEENRSLTKELSKVVISRYPMN